MVRKRGISNKLAYTLIAVFSFVLIGVGVYAYGGTSPSTMGHTLGEIAPPSGCSSGQFLTWTGTAWSCTTPSFGYQIISSSETGQTMADAYCTGTTKVIGGGCSTGSIEFDENLMVSVPASNGWYCRYNRVPTGGIQVYVICANL